MLYALGLPLLVFLFLRRHRSELDKPVVRFRYGLFFAGFREEKYYWEVVVAMRKESTVILAIFGTQMGVAMLAHVALFVFMIQMLFQLIGNPYEPQRKKLQIMDIIAICKFSRGLIPITPSEMYSSFFFSYLTLSLVCFFLLYPRRRMLVYDVEWIFLLHSSTSEPETSIGGAHHDCGIGERLFHVGTIVLYVLRNIQGE